MMKCVDCLMYDPVDGCYADNPGEDCDKIENDEMYEPAYNQEDDSM